MGFGLVVRLAVGFAGSGVGPATESETGILHPIFQGCQGWSSRAWAQNCSLLLPTTCCALTILLCTY